MHELDEYGRRHEGLFCLANLIPLERSLESLPNCRLIILDPIGSFLGGRLDASRDNAVRAVLGPLAKLAAEYSVAVVVVAHQRKATGTSADDLVMGSRAFTGLARSVMHVMSDPDDPSRRLLLPGKNNLAPPQSGLAFTIGTKLTWDEEPVESTADDVLRRQNSGGESDDGNRTVVDDAADFLTELLSAGPMAAAIVHREAKDARFSKTAIDRAKARLGVKSYKLPGEQHGGWMWALPKVPKP